MHPHLEEEIDALRELDEKRTRVYELRNAGIRALARAHKLSSGGEIAETSFDQALLELWCHPSEEPKDFIQASLQYVLASSRVARLDLGLGEEILHLQGRMKKKLQTMGIHDLFDWPGTHGARRLDDSRWQDVGDPSLVAPPNHSRVEIFQAARVFQALTRTPDTVFCAASMLSYYRIVRELYSIDAPNWMVGGARATRGGYPSAFMTGECTRGLNRFSNVVRETSKLIALLKLRRRQIYDTIATDSGAYLWSIMELKRQSLSLFNAVQNESINLFLTIPTKELAEFSDSFSDPIPNKSEAAAWLKQAGDRFDAFFLAVAKSLEAAAGHACSEIERATEAVARFHSIESVRLKNEGNPDAELRMGLAHATGFRALEGVMALAKEGLVASQALIRWSEKDFVAYVNDSDERIVDAWLVALGEAANRIMKIFTPAKVFVESVLDREIERGKSRKAHLGELIFAAATYICIERRDNDTRIQNAMDVILQELTADGQLTHPGHLDTDSHGYSLLLVMSEVHRALALLIGRSEVDVPVEVIDRMLQYFERTAVRFPEGGELCGWSHDFPRHPRCAYSWTTSLCVLALDRLGRTLDRMLNRRVGRHFTFRPPIPASQSSLSLSQLIYPDFGLATAGDSVLPDESRGQSVAFYMERMRTHVLGLPRLSSAPSDCYSIILYGPPGTGKTTLAESLAYSCRRALVEVTSSDFLVEGESFIERRARVVFEALSFLTHSVILFDEFDPMLRSREQEQPNGGRNVFSFLTPGLLPKLKLLNERAKNRQVAYLLLTNRIETLDEAAIRSGRFDHKLGIYPPDIITRIGYFINSLQKHLGTEILDHADDATIRRIFKALKDSAGRSLTGLARPGNLGALRRGSVPKAGTMMSAVESENAKTSLGEPDADFGRLEKAVSSRWTDLQRQQWKLIRDWDEKIDTFVAGTAFCGSLRARLEKFVDSLVSPSVITPPSRPPRRRSRS